MLVCSHVGLFPCGFVTMWVCYHVWFVSHVGLPTHALKGQKPLAQGIALGGSCAQGRRPVRAKAFKTPGE